MRILKEQSKLLEMAKSWSVIENKLDNNWEESTYHLIYLYL